MKKRITEALCLLLCALLLFSACRSAVPAPDAGESTPAASLPDSAEQTTGKPSASGLTTASDVPTSETPTPDTPTDETPTDETPTDETPTDDTPTEETPTPEPPLTIDRMTVENVEERLYKLTDREDSSVHAGIIFGKHLVTLETERDGTKVYSRDLTTGERAVLYVIEAFTYCRFVKTDRGGFLLTDVDGFCAWFENALDNEPDVLCEDYLPGEGEWADCSFLSSGWRIVRCGKTLEADDLFGETSVKTEIPEKYPYVVPVCVYEDKLVFIAPVYGETTVTYFLTLDKNGVFEEAAQRDGSSYSTSNSGELFFDDSSGVIGLLNFPELETVRQITFRNPSENRYFSNGRYLVTSSYVGLAANPSVSIYDYDGLLYYYGTTPFGHSTVFDEENALVLLHCSKPAMGEDGFVHYTETICFVDLAGAVGEATPDYAQLLDEKVRELEEKYPVTILTGDAAMIDFSDFTAEPMKNDLQTLEAVKILEKVFDDFPNGFLNELFSPENDWYVDHLTVCLTGTLKPTVDDSTSTPGAYAYTSDKMQYIVADVNYTSGLRSTFAHELMHAIDFYLGYVIPTEVYPQWHHYVAYMSLYNYGYVDENGKDFSDYSYTVSDEGREWFIDAYSKTYPIEDRARLFENMFCYEQNGCWFAPYGRIIDRMAYLSSVIREHFVSVQNSEEKPIWERAIDAARAPRTE